MNIKTKFEIGDNLIYLRENDLLGSPINTCYIGFGKVVEFSVTEEGVFYKFDNSLKYKIKESNCFSAITPKAIEKIKYLCNQKNTLLQILDE